MSGGDRLGNILGTPGWHASGCVRVARVEGLCFEERPGEAFELVAVFGEQLRYFGVRVVDDSADFLVD